MKKITKFLRKVEEIVDEVSPGVEEVDVIRRGRGTSRRTS